MSTLKSVWHAIIAGSGRIIENQSWRWWLIRSTIKKPDNLADFFCDAVVNSIRSAFLAHHIYYKIKYLSIRSFWRSPELPRINFWTDTKPGTNSISFGSVPPNPEMKLHFYKILDHRHKIVKHIRQAVVDMAATGSFPSDLGWVIVEIEFDGDDLHGSSF